MGVHLHSLIPSLYVQLQKPVHLLPRSLARRLGEPDRRRLDHEGFGDFTGFVVGNGDDGAVGYGGMGQEVGFELGAGLLAGLESWAWAAELSARAITKDDMRARIRVLSF